MPGDAVQALEFAQSKSQARKEGQTGVKLTDVAGADSTLEELKQVVNVIPLSPPPLPFPPPPPALPLSVHAWHRLLDPKCNLCKCQAGQDKLTGSLVL